MRLVSAIVLSFLCAVLSGCALSTTAGPSPAQGLALQGKVHGGQQAIYGAHVYLFGISASGYGRSSSSQLDAGTTGLSDSTGAYVLTDQNGNFSITGDYTCLAGADYYLLALGGTSDGNLTDANSASALMTILGECPSTALSGFLATEPLLTVNEVTTVAAAYAMAGFATDATHVSRSSRTLAKTGMANALANFFNLADLSTGTACTHTAATQYGDCVSSPNSNGTAPQQTLNTLANILAACVNSTSGTSPACTTLFENATSDGVATGSLGNATNPTDTATAAINIAHFPGLNTLALYGLQAGVAEPFSPNLSSAPNDLSLGLVFSGTHWDIFLAVDASGNIWTGGYSGGTVIYVLTPFGAPATTSNSGLSTNSPINANSISDTEGIAFDPSGNIWIADAANKIYTLSSSGGTSTINSGNPLVGNGLSQPWSIAFDGSGNSWVTDANSNNVSVFTSTGGTFSGSPFSGNGLSADKFVALDTAGNAWVSNTGAGNLSVFTSAGTATTTSNSTLTSASSPLTGNGLNFSFGVAIDPNGNAWVANDDGSQISVFTPTGATATTSNSTLTAASSPLSGNGMNRPEGLAIDGSGAAWVTNVGVGHLSEFSATGLGLSPNGVGGAFVAISVRYVAIDGSGNVWVVDSGSANTRIIELVGAATPVATPVVANLMSPYGSSTVNKP